MRVVGVQSRPGPRLLRACAVFGLAVERGGRANAAKGASVAAEHLARALRAPRVRLVLITGPSGGGKSTLLRALVRLERARGQCVVRLTTPPPGRALVCERVPGAARGPGALARAGLADASLLARRECDLSHGEHHRLLLARAMLRAGRRGATALLVADEFASCLDRGTARGLCRTLARWARSRGGSRVACATAHDDVLEWLNPDVLAWAEGGGLRVLERGSDGRGGTLRGAAPGRG